MLNNKSSLWPSVNRGFVGSSETLIDNVLGHNQTHRSSLRDELFKLLEVNWESHERRLDRRKGCGFGMAGGRKIVGSQNLKLNPPQILSIITRSPGLHNKSHNRLDDPEQLTLRLHPPSNGRMQLQGGGSAPSRSSFGSLLTYNGHRERNTVSCLLLPRTHGFTVQHPGAGSCGIGGIASAF